MPGYDTNRSSWCVYVCVCVCVCVCVWKQSVPYQTVTVDTNATPSFELWVTQRSQRANDLQWILFGSHRYL